MNIFNKIKVCLWILKGGEGMTLVFVLGLQMGILTPDMITDKRDYDAVYNALKNIGELHLLGIEE